MDNEQYNEGYLDVGEGHEIYYAEHGNANGVPLVLIHGGPGGRSYASQAALADLQTYRVIRFDQRGTGLSRYQDQMAGQTISNQVQDMEALRRHLGVEKWVMLGGSYGTTLSTHYRIAYPEAVSAHIMRAIFFGDEQGARHISDGGAFGYALGHLGQSPSEPILMKAWADYVALPNEIGEAEAEMDLLEAYSALMSHSDVDIKREAGLRFDRFDTAIATATPNIDLIKSLDDDPLDSVNLTRLFCHYALNEFDLMGKKRMLAGLNNTSDIPTILIHGAQDYICPVHYAREVRDLCPAIDVRLIADAGHSPADEPLRQAMEQALYDVALMPKAP